MHELLVNGYQIFYFDGHHWAAESGQHATVEALAGLGADVQQVENCVRPK